MLKRILLGLTIGVMAMATVAQAQESYLEMLRSDVRADKVTIITEIMQFTDEEAQDFWPVYRDFEHELERFMDKRVDLIRDYAQNYETMTDKKAKELIEDSMELNIKEMKLKKKYIRNFSKAVPGKTLGKFYQLENFLDLMIRVQISSELPLIK